MRQATDLESARKFVQAAAEKEHKLYLKLCELKGELPRGCRGYSTLHSFDACSKALITHQDKIKGYEEAIAGFNSDALDNFNKLLENSGLEIA